MHMHAHMQLTSNGLALVATPHREASVIDSYLLKMKMTALCSPGALLSNLPAVCGTHPFIYVYHL